MESWSTINPDTFGFFPVKRGPVAQLGARFHGMEEVVGSNPTRSTKSPIRINSDPNANPQLA